MKFCSACGNPVALRVPDNDDRERYVCEVCVTVHYENPRVVVGCLPVHENQILLCRRAIDPRHGYWTLPAGFLENGESSLEGALRETWEEARARVTSETLYTMFDLPYISQLYMFFRGELSPIEFEPGPESLDVQLFKVDDIPWDEIAFPVVTDTLKYYLADHKTGKFPVRTETMRWKRR